MVFICLVKHHTFSQVKYPGRILHYYQLPAAVQGLLIVSREGVVFRYFLVSTFYKCDCCRNIWFWLKASGRSEEGSAKPIIELGPLSTGNLGIGSMKCSEVKRKSVENPLTENGDVRLWDSLYSIWDFLGTKIIQFKNPLFWIFIRNPQSKLKDT